MAGIGCPVLQSVTSVRLKSHTFTVWREIPPDHSNSNLRVNLAVGPDMDVVVRLTDGYHLADIWSVINSVSSMNGVTRVDALDDGNNGISWKRE